MRYFAFVQLNTLGDPEHVTMSDQEIREYYFPQWESLMIEKYGVEEYRKNFCFEHCLEDWKTKHWGWEI